MMELKPYKNEIEKVIFSFIKSEDEFIKWSAGRFSKNHNALNDFYKENEYIMPFTFYYEDAPAGHLMIIQKNDSLIKFGHIILSPNLRGKGLAKKMLNLGLKKAKEMGGQMVYLTVFKDNVSAIECYKALGFKKTNREKELNINDKIYSLFDMEIEI